MENNPFLRNFKTLILMFLVCSYDEPKKNQWMSLVYYIKTIFFRIFFLEKKAAKNPVINCFPDGDLAILKQFFYYDFNTEAQCWTSLSSMMTS
jgi:hypothetical protein